MPKELNLGAYDYRNRRLSSRSSSNDSLYDEGEAALRGSWGTAATMGNDTVMTGDHVTAILRMQSASERQIQRLALGQPIASATVAGGAAADSDEESSSDSEGVVPKVCRRGSSANSVGSADLIAQDVGGHDNDNNNDDATPLLLGNTLHTTNKTGGNEGEQYGTAMGGDEQQHPISNLLRDRQNNNNNNNSSSDSNGNQNNSNGSEDSNNSNVYKITDNTSLLSSLASTSTKSDDNNKSSFISAVFNYSPNNESINEEEQQQQRLVKVYSQQLEQKERAGDGSGNNQEGGFENDEENQQTFPNVHHRLLDVPHYHNIRSSFTSLVGQIKERVVDSSHNNKKGEHGETNQGPPPVHYSDDHNEGQEDQYDLRLYDKPPSSSNNINNNSSASPSSNKKRAPPRRPIHRRTTIESDAMWNRRISTESESMWTRRNSNESESMWTMLSSSLTRRASNESESTNSTSANTYSTSHTANNSNANATSVGKESQLKKALSTLHDHDEEDNEPYDDSDIRSVASKGDTSWIGMGNLGSIIGSNIVNGSGASDGVGRMRKRGGGDERGDYQHGSSNGTFGNSSSGNKRRFRLNPFVRRASMTPFIGDDGGDYFDDDLSAKSYSYRPGITTLRRCGAILILIAITILCSVLIGIYIPASVVGEDEMMIMGDNNGGEELFKIAESINEFCHVNKLHSVKGRARCERICRNHLCCFDTLGDGYSCEDDKSKNCGVYAGCEVLVDSFDKEVMQYGGEDKNQAQEQGKHQIDDDAVILDGGFGDENQYHYDDFLMYYDDDENGGAGILGDHAIFYNPDGPSSATNTQAQPQAPSDDVPSLSTLDKFCTESAVSKVSGREKCEALCKDHHCCFDPVPKFSCRTDPDKMCSAYASCKVLTLEIDITDDIDENNDGAVTHEEIKIGLQVVGAACAESNISTLSGKQECEEICSSHLCCFSKTDFNCRNDPEKSCPSFAPCEILNVMAAEKGKANGVVYYDDHVQVGEHDSDPYNSVEAIQLNEEQKLNIQRDIESNCKSKSSPDCFHACRDWFCCFDPSDEKSCRSSTNNLCNLVQECEVAALTADILFSDEEEQTSDAEDVNQLPQEQVLQGQEDDYYQADDAEELISSQQLAFGSEEDSFPPPQQLVQQQEPDFEQSSSRPSQKLPSQKESSMKQDSIPTQQNDEFQSQPSSQQQSNLEQQSSFSQQQQQVPDFDESSSPPKSQMAQQIQDDQSDFRPPPPVQLQQQQQEGNFQPQDGTAQPQQMQQDQVDFRPPPPQFQQQQQEQQQDAQPQDVIVQPQQMQQDQVDFRPSAQDESDFQPQDSFFQPQQDQSDFRPPPPAQLQQQQQQQQGNSDNQQQDGLPQSQQDPSMNQSLQQPVPEQQITQAQLNMQDEFTEMQQEQNGQPFDHTAEEQQFAPQMQSQQPLEQFNVPPPVQSSPQQAQDTAQEQQLSTNLPTSKQPRPPPARCISTGDDDFHTETYNDDWNDDSYDRCKRWEAKYGMKISQYLDLYGVR